MLFAPLLALAALSVQVPEQAPEIEWVSLVVHVVDEEGEPYFGVPTHALLEGPAQAAARKRAGSRISNTDPDGEIVLEVPAGAPCDVRFLGNRIGVEDTTRTAAAIAPGEEGLLEVTLRSLPDATYSALVVDALTREPVEGALVVVGDVGRQISWQRKVAYELVRPETFDATADAQGAFSIEARTWREDSLMVHADGYAPRIGVIGGHGDAPGFSSPAEVELERPATLRLNVEGAPEGVSIDFVQRHYQLAAKTASSTRAFRETYIFRAVLDAEGRWIIEGLVPETFGDIVVTVGQREVVQTLARVETPEPGGVESLELDLRESGAVDGVYVDVAGSPVEGVEVWVVAGREPGNFRFSARPRKTALTDAEGRFHVEGLTRGTYSVGIPGQETETIEIVDGVAMQGGPGVARPITLVEVVELSGDEPTAEVRLAQVPGLTIEGTAYASDGKRAASAMLQAFHPSGWSTHARSDAEGRFALGPLPPGECSVHWNLAYATPHEFAEFATLEAGGRDVELRAKLGFAIEGRILHADGTEARGVRLNTAPEGGRTTWRPTVDGTFQVRGQPVGRVALYAHDDAELCSPLTVVTGTAGETFEGLELRLGPCAKLDVVNHADVKGAFVFIDGFQVAMWSAEAKGPIALAPGKIRIVPHEHSPEAFVPVEIELAPGESGTVELDVPEPSDATPVKD